MTAYPTHITRTRTRVEVKELTKILAAGSSILDIGAGNGNNSRYLADLRYVVHAVDQSDDALYALGTIQNITAEKADIVTYGPDAQYDAAVCCMVLHFLNKSKLGNAAQNISTRLTQNPPTM